MYISVTAACLAEPDRYGNHWPAIVHGATHINKSLCANGWEGQNNFVLVVYIYLFRLCFLATQYSINVFTFLMFRCGLPALFKWEVFDSSV